MGLVLVQRGYEVDVWLTSPELGSIYGLQFDLLHDSTQTAQVLEYGPGITVTDNPQPGKYEVVAIDTGLDDPLPSHLVTLRFTNQTVLTFDEVVGSDQLGNPLPLGAENGVLVVANVTFQWTNPNPPGTFVEAQLFQGENPVPDGTFNPVGPGVPEGTNQVTIDVPAGQGVIFFYVVPLGGFVEGTPSNVVSLSTDAPLALEGLTVTIN